MLIIIAMNLLFFYLGLQSIIHITSGLCNNEPHNCYKHFMNYFVRNCHNNIIERFIHSKRNMFFDNNTTQKIIEKRSALNNAITIQDLSELDINEIQQKRMIYNNVYLLF